MKHPDQGAFLPGNRLPDLLAAVTARGYRLLGPQLRDGAVVYDRLGGADDLPRGVHQVCGPGQVRLTQSDSPRCFAWANGPQALKPLLFRPAEPLWRASRDAAGRLRFEPLPPVPEPVAVLGVRACDLAALTLLDRHFMGGETVDGHYAARRARLLLIAVNCTHPAATCFCAATGDGPEVRAGFDLRLDELDEGYLVAAGSDAGAAVLAALPLTPASAAQRQAARDAVAAAASRQTRRLPAGDLYPALAARRQHPHWEAVAGRCLACGNCTAVCPTCFCSREQARPRLDGAASEQWREWDSCFSDGHSYIHGLVIRQPVAHRYRQWLTHKLGGWFPQYGRSGCVGCGRCIAWCPVGIDITEEVQALLGDAHGG